MDLMLNFSGMKFVYKLNLVDKTNAYMLTDLQNVYKLSVVMTKSSYFLYKFLLYWISPESWI